jgi:flagellar hook protein FlgE
MSLYGAMIAGVSGLKAQSTNLATISDNISNLNTTAYKRTQADFSTLVTGVGNTYGYSPGGVRTQSRPLVDQQGVLQASQRPTDVAILGNGFFVVNTNAAGSPTGEQLYTRAGSFSEDNQGRLVNASGYYLQGWALDQQGNISNVNQIQTVSVGTLNGVAVNTAKVEIGINLNSQETPDATAVLGDFGAVGNFTTLNDLANTTGTIDPDFQRQIRIYDSLGTPHDLTVSFAKVAPATSGQWGFTVSAPASEVNAAGMPAGPAGTDSVVAYGSITFNGDGSLGTVNMYANDGTPAWAAAGSNNTAQIAWSNGANNSTMDLNFGTPGKTDGMTQFASAYNVAFTNQDGAPVGLRTGVFIDQDGFVTATFSNGAVRKIYQLPIATFADPNSLRARNGNAYQQTTQSGEFNLRAANNGGAGRIEPSSLEGSNVDLGQEFTNMIVTQRAYGANAKTITTADEMLQELMQIKR